MLKEKKCETPHVTIKESIISDAEKILKPQHLPVGNEDRVQRLESDMKMHDPDKITTIEVSYSTKHLESDLKMDNPDRMATIEVSYNTKERLDPPKVDRESYESVIQRLIERSAARACCAARWM